MQFDSRNRRCDVQRNCRNRVSRVQRHSVLTSPVPLSFSTYSKASQWPNLPHAVPARTNDENGRLLKSCGCADSKSGQGNEDPRCDREDAEQDVRLALWKALPPVRPVEGCPFHPTFATMVAHGVLVNHARESPAIPCRRLIWSFRTLCRGRTLPTNDADSGPTPGRAGCARQADSWRPGSPKLMAGPDRQASVPNPPRCSSSTAWTPHVSRNGSGRKLSIVEIGNAAYRPQADSTPGTCPMSWSLGVPGVAAKGRTEPRPQGEAATVEITHAGGERRADRGRPLGGRPTGTIARARQA